MKKLVCVLCLCALAFASCKEEPNDDGTPKVSYNGTYVGEYTFGKGDSTKNGNIVVINNPVNDGILLYGILPFKKTDTTGFFRASSATTETMVKVLTAIGIHLPAGTSDALRNLDATAAFRDGVLTMKMSYSIEILEAQVDVNMLQFVGTKKSKLADEESEGNE